MAALNQLQRSFAFADAAFAYNENSFAEAVHQPSVERDAGRQLNIQIPDQVRHEAGRTPFGPQDGHMAAPGNLQNLFFIRQMDAPADNQTGNMRAEKPGKNIPALLRRP